jgi:hypothetical protein
MFRSYWRDVSLKGEAGLIEYTAITKLMEQAISTDQVVLVAWPDRESGSFELQKLAHTIIRVDDTQPNFRVLKSRVADIETVTKELNP